MYILLVIVMLNSSHGAAATIQHLYYDSELNCNMAARTIEHENNRFVDYKLKAFCVKGD